MQSSADRLIVVLFLFLIHILIFNTASAGGIYSFEVPDDVVDVAVAVNGNIHILFAGKPNIRIYEDTTLTAEYDLSGIVLPGGFAIDNDWGWFVSDAVSGTIQKYDNSGELLETFSVSERPGDVALLGLTVIYISRADGSIKSIDETDFPQIPIRSSGNGEITVSGIYAIYSDGNESVLFTPGDTPEIIPSTGIWAFAGEEELYLTEDSLYYQGTETESVFTGDSELNRISSSPSGRYVVLWHPGCRSIMVVQ